MAALLGGSARSVGSATVVTASTPSVETDGGGRDRLVLRLAPPPSVTWADDVVDNEGMNRRSSKAC